MLYLILNNGKFESWKWPVIYSKYIEVENRKKEEKKNFIITLFRTSLSQSCKLFNHLTITGQKQVNSAKKIRKFTKAINKISFSYGLT
jgi:hypothetical protein